MHWYLLHFAARRAPMARLQAYQAKFLAVHACTLVPASASNKKSSGDYILCTCPAESMPHLAPRRDRKRTATAAALTEEQAPPAQERSPAPAPAPAPAPRVKIERPSQPVGQGSSRSSRSPATTTGATTTTSTGTCTANRTRTASGAAAAVDVDVNAPGDAAPGTAGAPAAAAAAAANYTNRRFVIVYECVLRVVESSDLYDEDGNDLDPDEQERRFLGDGRTRTFDARVEFTIWDQDQAESASASASGGGVGILRATRTGSGMGDDAAAAEYLGRDLTITEVAVDDAPGSGSDDPFVNMSFAFHELGDDVAYFTWLSPADAEPILRYLVRVGAVDAESAARIASGADGGQLSTDSGTSTGEEEGQEEGAGEDVWMCMGDDDDDDGAGAGAGGGDDCGGGSDGALTETASGGGGGGAGQQKRTAKFRCLVHVVEVGSADDVGDGFKAEVELSTVGGVSTFSVCPIGVGEGGLEVAEVEDACFWQSLRLSYADLTISEESREVTIFVTSSDASTKVFCFGASDDDRETKTWHIPTIDFLLAAGIEGFKTDAAEAAIAYPRQVARSTESSKGRAGAEAGDEAHGNDLSGRGMRSEDADADEALEEGRDGEDEEGEGYVRVRFKRADQETTLLRLTLDRNFDEIRQDSFSDEGRNGSVKFTFEDPNSSDGAAKTLGVNDTPRSLGMHNMKEEDLVIEVFNDQTGG